MINSNSPLTREVRAAINLGSIAFSRTGRILVARVRELADRIRNSGSAGGGYTSQIRYNRSRGALAYKDDPSTVLVFQFNPEKLSDKKLVEYAERSRPARDFVEYIWLKGGKRTISFELTLDATQGSNTSWFNKPGKGLPKEDDPNDSDPKFRIGSVSTHNPDKGTLEQVEFLQSLQRPYSKGETLEAKFAYNGVVPKEQFLSPPEVIFSYGPLYFEGVIEDLDVEHELFDRNLVPTRSRINLTLWIQEADQVQPIDSLLSNNVLNSYQDVIDQINAE